MKKTLRNIAILMVLLLGGYFIYDYLQVDYIPEKKRKFYTSKNLQKLKPKFKRRQLLHDEMPEKIEAEPVAVNITGTGKGLGIIKETIKALDQRNKECESFLSNQLPNEEIIDPENPIFSSPERVNAKMSTVLNNILNRTIALDALSKFEDYFRENNEVEADLFFNSLRSTLICRGADTGLFLESAYEAMKQGNWSKEEIDEFNGNMLAMLATSLETDILPDNLLFSLNILRLVGSSTKQNEEFYVELDEVYGRISAYEDNFFDEIQDSKTIYSPGDKFQNYFEELEEISDEVRYIINRRFKDFSGNN
jgi:hypoxanthine phosphoribosyltransferase